MRTFDIKAVRAQRRRDRRCIFCNAGLQELDGVLCVECADKNRETSRAYRATEAGKKADRDNRRKRYHADPERFRSRQRERQLEAKCAGKCPVCGDPSGDETVTCDYHAQLARERGRRRNAKIKEAKAA